MRRVLAASLLLWCPALLPWCPAFAGPVAAQERLTVTFFIASDCPISNRYAPEIARVCRAQGTKGVSCRLVYEDLKPGPDAVTGHMREYGLAGVPATTDPARRLADAAHVTITPTAVVTDGRERTLYEGRIDNLYINVGRTRQQVTSHDLTDALDAIRAGKPVRQAKTEPLGCYIERP